LISCSVEIKGDDNIQMAEYGLEIKQGNSSFCSLRQDLERCSWNALQLCQLPTIDIWARASNHCYTLKSQEVTEKCMKAVVWPQLLRRGNPCPLSHWHEVGRTRATEFHFWSSRKSRPGRTAGSWQMLEALSPHPWLWL